MESHGPVNACDIAIVVQYSNRPTKLVCPHAQLFWLWEWGQGEFVSMTTYHDEQLWSAIKTTWDQTTIISIYYIS